MIRRVLKYCRPCSGTGSRVKSAQPLRFKTCNRCSGKGGKIARAAE